jgi:thiol:disulfide interchange protein
MTIIKKFALLIFIISWTISCGTKKEIVQNPFPNDKEVDNLSQNKEEVKVVDTIQEKSEIVYSFLFSELPELSQVLDEAQKTGKKVYVDIGAEWCIPCKLMKRDVYTHQETADFFNENFINYMVDIEKNEGPDLKLIFEIESVPTLLWLNAKGGVLHKKEGACYQKDLIQNAKIALGK